MTKEEIDDFARTFYATAEKAHSPDQRTTQTLALTTALLTAAGSPPPNPENLYKGKQKRASQGDADTAALRQRNQSLEAELAELRAAAADRAAKAETAATREAAAARRQPAPSPSAERAKAESEAIGEPSSASAAGSQPAPNNDAIG